MISRKWATFVCMLALVFSSGCSVFMAAKQPDKKNVDLFRMGTPRTMLLGEFGPPVTSEIRNGRKYEVFFPAHWDPKLRIPRGQVVAAASIVSPKY